MDDEQEGIGQNGAESGVRGESSHLLFLITSNMDGWTIRTSIDGVKMELNATHPNYSSEWIFDFIVLFSQNKMDDERGRDWSRWSRMQVKPGWEVKVHVYFFLKQAQDGGWKGRDWSRWSRISELFLCIFIVLLSKNKMEDKEEEKMELNTSYVCFSPGGEERWVHVD